MYHTIWLRIVPILITSVPGSQNKKPDIRIYPVYDCQFTVVNLTCLMLISEKKAVWILDINTSGYSLPGLTTFLFFIGKF